MISSCVVCDGAIVNPGSDEGSVDEHERCLVCSPSLACDPPHQVEDWLTLLDDVLYVAAPIHSVVRDQSEEFSMVDEVQLCIPQFDFRAAGLPGLAEHHSDGLVDGHIESLVIAPGLDLLDRGLAFVL